VVTTQGNQKKVKINYPTTWKYKLIAKKQEHIEDVVNGTITEKKYKLSVSNSSKGGKFISMSLEVQVVSEEERLHLFKQFETHQDIKYVL
jgi:putative lipoic acid-binding regulatory protein